MPTWLLVALAAATAAALYVPTLSYELIWDDPRILREALPALTSPISFLFPPHGVSDFDKYYRPLTYSLFWVVWAAGGGATALHGLAVGLYALDAGLVAWLARRLLGDADAPSAGALAAGLVFAAHPAHVEVAAWIGPINETLPLALSLGALIAYDSARRGARLVEYALSLALCLLALLCKETALLLPLLMAGLELQRPGRMEPAQRRAATVRLAGLLLPWAIYFVLRSVSLGGAGDASSGIDARHASIVVAAAAVSYYLRLLGMPIETCHFVADVPPFTLASALLLIAGVVAAALAVWYRRRAFAVFYAIGWLLITLVPGVAVALSDLATVPLSERYAYVSSTGVALLAGAFIAYGTRWRVARRVFVLALVLLGARVSTARSTAFADDGAFWAAAELCAPGHCLPSINLADRLMARNEVARAAALYRHALDLACKSDQRGLALAHLGIVYYRQGDQAAAAETLRESISTYAEYSVPHYILGRMALERATDASRGGDARLHQAALEEARSSFAAALAVRPHDPEYLYAVGQVEYFVDDREAAAAHLREALALAPQHDAAAVARSMLARLGP